MLAVLGRLGWSRRAAITTRWQPGGLSPSIPIIVGFLIPAVGMLSGSWEPAGKIVALSVDYLATGFYEVFANRVCSPGLATRLGERSHASTSAR